MENNILKDTKNTIVPCLMSFLANVKDLSKSSLNAEYNSNLCVQFVTGIINDLKADSVVATRNSENNFPDANNYGRRSLLDKEMQKYEKLQQELHLKINRKNKINHYFQIVDKRLEFAMKKTIIKSEAIIIAAMKEHEHKMLNLEVDCKRVLSNLESNANNYEVEKNKRISIKNNLKDRKSQIIRAYDSEMIKKYKTVNELNSKIKTIEDNIFQLKESISRQMPFYNDVITEQEAENDRIWHEKLYEIQRKIAARKIQINFRRYLNFIKTRDSKKNKKGQYKKNQSKTKNI